MWRFLMWVGLDGWLGKVPWLGKLVSVFWWVELDFFFLECNEVFTELYRGEKEEEGDRGGQDDKRGE